MVRRTFPKDAGERVTLQARTTTATRDRLQVKANAAGRSLSQEMEMRLEQSLSSEDVVEHTAKLLQAREQPLIDTLGGPETFGLLQDIAFLVEGVEDGQGQRWFESAELRAQLFRVLEAALPSLIRAERTPGPQSTYQRALAYSQFLPERPKKPVSEVPEGVRFMTGDELKQFFHRNDDNA